MNDNPGVGLAVVMEVVSILGYHGFGFFNRLRAKMARGQGREFPSLSNIGVMDPKVLDFGDAQVRQARFFGPVMFPPTFYVVSGSFEDTLYFTASYPKNVVPEGLMERFLDRLVERARRPGLMPRPRRSGRRPHRPRGVPPGRVQIGPWPSLVLPCER